MRELASAIDSAVGAAHAEDATALADALASLARGDADVVAVLLGDVTRALLEHAFPDGLDTDDAEQLLAQCRAWAKSFLGTVDEDALVVAVTGALGIGGAGEGAQVAAGAVVRHGVVVIAHLLAADGLRLAPFLSAALTELHRAQTVELP